MNVLAKRGECDLSTSPHCKRLWLAFCTFVRTEGTPKGQSGLSRGYGWFLVNTDTPEPRRGGGNRTNISGQQHQATLTVHGDECEKRLEDILSRTIASLAALTECSCVGLLWRCELWRTGISGARCFSCVILGLTI